MAAVDKAAASLDNSGPPWLGPYALTGSSADKAIEFARAARSARRRQKVDAKTYLLPPEPHDMRKWHAKVRGAPQGRGALDKCARAALKAAAW